MARPPKPTFRGGIIPTSSASALADLGDYGVDPPAVIARRIAAQSIPTGSATQITLDSAYFASISGAGMFTAPSVSITITDSGLYTCYGYMDMVANTTGIRQLEIVQNGTAVLAHAQNAIVAFSNRHTISGALLAISGDTLQLWAFQSQGVSQNLTAARYAVVRASG
jgi:hypothetical protein